MKRKLTSSLLIGMLAGTAATAANAQSPKIVVGIVVDQLRTDYIEQLRPYFGDKGFNRLINEGAYLTDVDFSRSVSDAPSGAAVVYTGAWPSANGMASAMVLDESQRRSVPTLSDPLKQRIEYSPENLKVSTLADEFFINNGNLSKIYSIGGDAQVAVVTAGHAGNAAVWLDEMSGKWNTPAYYGALPPAISNRNRTSPLSSKVASTTWRPLRHSSAYPMAKTWNSPDFSYNFSAGRDSYLKFKAAAPFNTEVTDAAIDLIRSMQGSQHGMISLEYSVAPYRYDYDGDNRPELTDAYVALDADLGRLLEAIDRSFPGEAMVFLTSTGYAHEPAIPDADARIPSGEITLKQAESLLNSYLSASYGNGDYVALIKDGKLFLNSKEASKRGVDIKTLRKEVKDFLLRMGGVNEAYTIDEVVHADTPRMLELSRSLDVKNSPDLFLFFTPGWTVTDDNAYPSVSEKVRMATPPTPAFLLAPTLEAQIVTERVDATAIAPTIASEIHIRAPNAAATRPLTLKHRN